MTVVPLLAAALLGQAGGGAAIRVGDLALTPADVEVRAAEYLRTGSRNAPSAEAFVDGLVDELLLATDAQRSGFALSPDARAAVASARAKALARLYFDREFLGKARVPEDQLRALYHETRDTARLRLVIVATREEAAAVRARLASGGDFALEASRSMHKSSASKGDTGAATRRDLDPALAKVAFETPLATLFGPVELGLGFAVGQVVERTVVDEKGLEAERPTLEAWVRRQFAGQARAHFLSMSRRQRGVVLDEPFLRSLGKSTEMNEAQAEHPIATISGRPVKYRELAAELRTWSSTGGHMFGPNIRLRVAEAHLDNLLLAAAAEEARLPVDPAVGSALRITELSALANAQAVQLGSKVSAEKRDRLVQGRLAELRKQIPISVDRPAAVAAAQRAAQAPATAR